MDFELNLDALGLGATAPADVAGGAGSFTVAMPPRHGTEGTLLGRGGRGLIDWYFWSCDRP